MIRETMTSETTMQSAQTMSQPTITSFAERIHAMNWERIGVLYARLALGTAFLSAVCGRFGLWHGSLDLNRFARFLHNDVAETLAFMPKATIPFFGCAATVCETSLGILLILGLWPRWVALASATLLAIFGASMAISLGLKEPMDYSVFSASSAAVLLALYAFRHGGETKSR